MSNSKITNQKPAPKSRKWLWAVIICLVLLAAAGIIVACLHDGGATGPTGTATGSFDTVGTTPNVQIGDVEDVSISLGKGLEIINIGSYTGLFMEQGADEIVSRVLMLVVKNTGDQTVQYGEIQLTDGTITAGFQVTTLPPGESTVLLELNKMSYEDGKALTQASAQNVAMFATEPSLCEDRIKIQALEGVLNVTNISGQDIAGNIVIYYKNSSTDMPYGGITYRVTISGGLKAGEIRQITADHFSAKGSRVMFITCG